MTLPDLCEPVFLCLCRLSRRHRAGVALSSRAVRDELAGLLVDLRAQASLSPGLLPQFERTEPAIILCIDHAVRTSDWPCAKSWLSTTRATVGTDDDATRFFALLRQNLDDPSQAADERLEVLASCVALAFVAPDLSDARRAAVDQLRLRLGVDTPTALWPRSRLITDDLSRPSPAPAIAFVAIGLCALAALCAISSFRSSAMHATTAAGTPSRGPVASAEPPP